MKINYKWRDKLRTNPQPMGAINCASTSGMTHSSLWWNISIWLNKIGINLNKGPWIFTYHRITEPKDTIPDATELELYKEHLLLLKKYTELIPIDLLLKRVDEGRTSGKEAAVIFDDGYVDQGDAAKLALSLDVPTAICISTQYPDSPLSFYWEGRTAEESEKIKSELRLGGALPQGLVKSEILSWNEIAELKQLGVCILLHSHSHNILSGLNIKNLKADIFESVSVYKERLGENPDILVYPNGDWCDVNKNVDTLSKMAGIKYGLMSVFGNVRKKDMPWRIRRVLITNNSVAELEALLRTGVISSALKSGLDFLRGRR